MLFCRAERAGGIPHPCPSRAARGYPTGRSDGSRTRRDGPLRRLWGATVARLSWCAAK